MMKVYISLPITGREIDEARQHADRIKKELSAKGYSPISPFDILQAKGAEYADFIGTDITVMLKQDAVIFCKGWENSCGCNIEHDVVMRVKAHGVKDIKVMYEQ